VTWWRVVVRDVMGAVFWDHARSRDEALRVAAREDRDRVGWPRSEVIEFDAQGKATYIAALADTPEPTP